VCSGIQNTNKNNLNKKVIKITEKKNYIWIIPLISGIIAIIGLLTPMAYYNITEWDEGRMHVEVYFWIWCLVTMSVSANGYSMSETNFVSDSTFLFQSLITTVFIVLITINFFILTKSAKTKKLKAENFVKSSLISGLLFITVMIFHIIAIDILVYNGIDFFGEGASSDGIHFWKVFDIGFGVIAPFLSGLLVIIGACIFKYQSKQEDEIISIKPITIKETTEIKKIKHKVPSEATQIPITELKFCHSCGKKIKKIAIYCEFCGINQ